MTDATRTLATDEATASVRPADARYNQHKYTPEQLREIREQEIAEATEQLLRDRKAEEDKNQEALDASGYVNPTVQPEESPVAKAFEKVYGSGADSSSADAPADSGTAKKSAAAKSGN